MFFSFLFKQKFKCLCSIHFFLHRRVVAVRGLSIIVMSNWIVFLLEEIKLSILFFELNLFFIIFVVLK
jgi:hypothetical protein